MPQLPLDVPCCAFCAYHPDTCLWGRVIHTYCPQLHDPLIKFGEKSSGGRGGMVAKAGLSSLPSA